MFKLFSVFIFIILSLRSFAYDVSPFSFESTVEDIYLELNLKREGLDFEIFRYAFIGRDNILKIFPVASRDYLTIIDYSKSSNFKRMYIIDLSKLQLIDKLLVAHAKKTGNEYARYFSNVKGSNMSSLGFFITLNLYLGSHGLSLRLEGVERGFNDNAYDRAIVMHGAEYVSQDFIREYGRLGRSLGCPSIPVDYVDQMIPLLASGTIIFSYYPQRNYLRNSKLIRRYPNFLF